MHNDNQELDYHDWRVKCRWGEKREEFGKIEREAKPKRALKTLMRSLGNYKYQVTLDVWLFFQKEKKRSGNTWTHVAI